MFKIDTCDLFLFALGFLLTLMEFGLALLCYGFVPL